MSTTTPERLRALATDLARPGADPLAVARQIARLADEIDQAQAHARPQHGATPAPTGTDRLWRTR